ncbi:MAG: guanylate kinase [Alphaproteobacteria bacterium]|nr:guanylate kinase [Alphaproteobacteria bacterium]
MPTSSSTRALAIVISGPSGVGKSSIAHALVHKLDAVFSVSMTTRAKTDQDREGVDYYFVDESAFRRAIDENRLLEWAEVFGHLYGTPRRMVEQQIHAGRDVILEIDVAGGKQIKAKMPEALAIFIDPPSKQHLLDRLNSRGRDDEPMIERRFREARREMAEARDCGAYDHFVVNDDLDTAINRTLDIVHAHRSAT